MRFLTHRRKSAPANQPHAARPTTFADKLAAQLTQTEAHGHSAAPSAQALLLDLSGSMLSDAGTGRTKLEELAGIVRRLPPVRRFGFSHACCEIQTQVDIEDAAYVGSGFLQCTDMAGAFEAVKRAGSAAIVLITDGIPDDEDAALSASSGLVIHIFYVGPEPVPQFLRDLATRTGGRFEHGKFTAAMAIETKIRGLLTGPALKGG